MALLGRIAVGLVAAFVVVVMVRDLVVVERTPTPPPVLPQVSGVAEEARREAEESLAKTAEQALAEAMAGRPRVRLEPGQRTTLEVVHQGSFFLFDPRALRGFGDDEAWTDAHARAERNGGSGAARGMVAVASAASPYGDPVEIVMHDSTPPLRDGRPAVAEHDLEVRRGELVLEGNDSEIQLVVEVEPRTHLRARVSTGPAGHVIDLWPRTRQRGSVVLRRPGAVTPSATP